MDRAGLLDGMVAWVRITRAAKHRDIVVVRQADDSLTVKRLFRSRRAGNLGGAWLVPESTERCWKPRPMGEGDAIVGVVVRADGPASEDRRNASP